MPSAVKYSFPLPAAVGEIPDESRNVPAAFFNMKKRGVTGFNSYLDAQIFYLVTIAWGFGTGILDGFLIWTTSKHSGTVGNSPSIVGNENQWAMALAATMAATTALSLIFQGANVIYYHFSRWPITSATWFFQFLGAFLASSIVGMYLFYQFDNVAQRDQKLAIAVSNLVVRVIYISVQLGIAVEYFVKSIPDPQQ